MKTQSMLMLVMNEFSKNVDKNFNICRNNLLLHVLPVYTNDIFGIESFCFNITLLGIIHHTLTHPYMLTVRVEFHDFYQQKVIFVKRIYIMTAKHFFLVPLFLWSSLCDWWWLDQVVACKCEMFPNIYWDIKPTSGSAQTRKMTIKVKPWNLLREGFNHLNQCSKYFNMLLTPIQLKNLFNPKWFQKNRINQSSLQI